MDAVVTIVVEDDFLEITYGYVFLALLKHALYDENLAVHIDGFRERDEAVISDIYSIGHDDLQFCLTELVAHLLQLLKL